MSYSNSKSSISKPSSYINLNCFNYSSDPVDSLQSIFQQNWQIKSLEISSHGNNGVVFIQTSIGSFVLKTNNEAPSDLFFNHFARLIDVNVPEVQILCCYEEFFSHLVFQIQKFCQKDQSLTMRLKKRMDYPFYQIMQYIPSISFLQVGPQRFQKHQLTEDKLRSIGICIGFDLIINNNDRFKLSKVWGPGNEGNVANIMIKIPDHFSVDKQKIKNREDLTTKLGEYYFIDHGGSLLDIEKNKAAADNFKKYMQRVALFHDQMIQFIRKQLPCPEAFNGLVSQIQFYTKYRLSEENILQIIEGIIYSTTMFIEFFEKKAIEEILQDLYKDDKSPQLSAVMKYWNEYWNTDVDKIKLKHLEIYHLKVSAIYITFGEVVRGICERVAQKITATKQSLKSIPSRKGSKRSQSKNSISSRQSQSTHKSNKPRLTQQQSLKQFEKVLFSDQQIGSNEDPDSIERKSPFNKQPTKQQAPLQQQKKNKLKQRLQKYTQNNYDQNYEKNHNHFSKRNIQSMESFISDGNN